MLNLHEWETVLAEIYNLYDDFIAGREPTQTIIAKAFLEIDAKFSGELRRSPILRVHYEDFKKQRILNFECSQIVEAML